MAAIDTIRLLLEAAPSSVCKNGPPIYEQFSYSRDIYCLGDATQEDHTSDKFRTSENLKNNTLKYLRGVDGGRLQDRSVAELSFLVAQLGNPQAAFSLVETVANEAAFGINAPSLLGWLLIRSINVQVEDWDTPVRKVTFNRPPLAHEKIYRAINQAEGRKQDGVYAAGRLMRGFQEDMVPQAFVPETGFIHFDLHTLDRREQEARLDERGQKFIHPGKLALAMAAHLVEHGVDQALNRYQENYYWVRTEEAMTRPQQGESGLVRDLYSYARGVCDLVYRDASRPRRVVPAGSLHP